MMEKKKKIILIAVGSVLVLGLGFIAYRTIKKSKEQKALEDKK
jgi:flagellar basal body-associated protein FliL